MATNQNTTETKLLARVEDLAAWVKANPGKLPSSYTTAPDDERLLGYFLARQRINRAAGRAHHSVLVALDETLPGWDRSQKARAKAPAAAAEQQRSRASVTGLDTVRRWGTEIAAVAAEIGHDPSQTGATKRERLAALHLAFFRSDARLGVRGWSPEHTAVLDEVYPGWNRPNSRERLWETRVAELAAHVAERGWPSERGDVATRTLHRWLTKRRYEARRGLPAMTPQRAERLDDLVPGWRWGA
ncbi:helicase associated domain-containing protein [Cellulosimicrobium sp. Marseille-Q4280]|uniref:helicase associated domain-containing protein n=1 Tax=Cellulosimicrobium sp. Marseille-Q4280 TaxID=2937992 RepID=UPI00203CD133|nr:helicase associated domain-containing protein [Cellulosimicrobium sp. Marseille-Q4280]